MRADLERHFREPAPENAPPYYRHLMEGPDDMPAHISVVPLGSSLTIAVSNGRFRLGTWQDIYLCKHRKRGGGRRLVITLTREGKNNA